MDQQLSRLLTAGSLLVLAAVLSVSACAHTNDRVVEPVSGSDAGAPPPEVGDSGVSPIGPIAYPVEPEKEDFRLVRAPEFGVGRDVLQVVALGVPRQTASGGSGVGGAAGFAGSDLRPVACGGGYY